MKKALALTVSLVLGISTFTFTAMADDADKPYIAVVCKGFQHQFWQIVKSGSDAAAEDLGVEITFDGPASESDIADQVNMLKAAMDKEPDAICFAALDTNSVMEELNTCLSKGIPVIGFDSGVPGAPEGSIYATASTNNYMAATIGAEKLMENEDFKAALDAATPEEPIMVGVLAQDATSESLISRTAGFVDKLVELIGEDDVKVEGHDLYLKDAENPKVIITVNVPASTSAMDQKTGAEYILSQPNLVACYASNGGSTDGYLAASNDGSDFNKENGKYKDIQAVGFDAGKPLKTAIANGWFIGAITQDPYQIGYQAVKLAVDAINGVEAETELVDTGAVWYNAENIEDPEVAVLLYD